VIKLARRVTEKVWSEHIAEAADRQVRARRAAKDIDARIDTLVDQLVKSTSTAVRSRLEARIEGLEQEARRRQRLAERRVLGGDQFGTALKRVFGVLDCPQELWRTGTLEQRRIIQSLMFTSPIEYSAGDGFGTTKFSLPFKLLQLDRQEKQSLVEAATITSPY